MILPTWFQHSEIAFGLPASTTVRIIVCCFKPLVHTSIRNLIHFSVPENKLIISAFVPCPLYFSETSLT